MPCAVLIARNISACCSLDAHSGGCNVHPAVIGYLVANPGKINKARRETDHPTARVRWPTVRDPF